MDKVKVYGAHWCDDTHQTRAYLDALGVQYQYFDVDKDPQAKKWVIAQNDDGKQRTPTVAVGGRILVEPENDHLDELLRDADL